MKKIITIILSLLIFSCTSIKIEQGKDYILVNEEFKPAVITLAFKDDIIYGKSGINRYTTSYVKENGKIKINAIASTRMAGDPKIMDIEHKYLVLLSDMKSIKVHRDYIVITTKDDYKLKFVK